jgi:RNA polymerase sigma-70 factor (ECF subfamily)
VEGRPLDDAELVTRAQRGDISAYEDLVRMHEGLALRAAFLIVGDHDEAEDAVQTAFVKAYYALPRFHTGAPFRPWLLRIVTNEARNRRTSVGRRAQLALRLSDAGPRVDAAPSPEAAAARQEERERLLAAVRALPEREALVVAYRFFLDLSEAETAQALGCPTGTVKSRLSRALARLRITLQREEGDADG